MVRIGSSTWIAALRARESARPDRLFDDPWAARLAGDEGREIMAASERAGGGRNEFLPVRVRFFDDALLAAASWAAQVVLLGAGLDTRAYRLPLPAALTVYELDVPAPLAAKAAVLAGATPACGRRAVPVDLRTDWSAPLLAAGFDRSAPSVWLAEGLLYYLDPPSVDALLSRTAALSGGRAEFLADVFGTALLARLAEPKVAERRRRAGIPPPFCTDEPVALFARNGWPGATVTRPGEPAANYGRLDGAVHADAYLVLAARGATS